MALYKQLWVAIALLLAVVFSINVWVTTLSARDYLSQQLTIKNADNAGALALSLSQQGADPVLLELTLAAQFDTGFYEYIELVDPAGNSAVLRSDDTTYNDAPQWFTRLFPIDAQAGTAAVQAGWQQAGTLSLRSHSRFAYRELWLGTLRQAGIFLLAAILAGLIGARALKGILRPLNAVVRQAEALRKKRFVTTPEPATLEFKQLVRAMNGVSSHVKSMLDQETRRLENWQRQAEIEPVTGLNLREPFLRKLGALLDSRDALGTGTLVLLRLANLARLNQDYGRPVVDELLRDIGDQLKRNTAQQTQWNAGRLNGSDFLLVAPADMQCERVAQDMIKIFERTFSNHNLGQVCALFCAARVYQPEDNVSQLLTQLDTALTQAPTGQGSSLVVCPADAEPAQSLHTQGEQWRQRLTTALQEGRLTLAKYAVVNSAGELAHYERPVSLRENEASLSAAAFLPWVRRLKLDAELDRAVVDLALGQLQDLAESTAIHLSAAPLYDKKLRDWLVKRLQQQAELASSLQLEFPQEAVFSHVDSLKRLTGQLQPIGVRIGMSHAGHQLAQLGQLHDLGLDYLKVDASFIGGIADNSSNQTLLSAFCTLGHAIGMQVLAEGVQNVSEWQTLQSLGLDGATGPGIAPN